MNKRKNLSKIVLAVSIVVAIVLSVLMVGIDTSWGTVEVKLGKLISDDGKLINYKIYIPETATAQTPAPAVLYGAGGADSADSGRSFSIEASRRGFVVMTIDVPGNGQSESLSSVVRFDANNQPVVSQDDPTRGHEMAYQYLTSLPFVDKTRMVTGGHSMGGRYTVQVAQNHQDEVQLQFNVGMNFYGTADLGYDFNFALLMGSSDESSLVRTTNYSTMDEIFQSPDLKAVFGLGEDERLETETIYGDFSNGTGRVVYTPHTLHIWEPYTNEVVVRFLECVDMTMEMPNYIEPSDTVFVLRDYMIIAQIAVLAVFLASLCCVLLDTESFAELKLKVSEYKGLRPYSGPWWVAAAVLTILCGAFVIWASMQTGGGRAAYFSTFGNAGFKCLWSVVTGAALLVYVLVFYFAFGKKNGTTLKDFGLATGEDGKFHVRYLLKALLFALIVFAAGLGAFQLFYYFTGSNLHWIAFEISPIPLQRAGSKFLMMMLLMLPFVLMNGIAQRTVLRLDGEGTGATVRSLILSNVLCAFTLTAIHVYFVANAYFLYRTVFPIDRGYIGGEQVMGVAVGMIIINSIGFFVNKKTNTVWVSTLLSLPIVAWFQIVASGMTF